jgi:sugar phosphate permease
MLVAADRSNLGIALPSIKTEFHISNTEAGLFATLMFTCFAVAQIPSSFLCRRVGPRSLMTVALAFTALASYLIGTSKTPFDIKLYRSLLGVAEASISVCCVTTINNWFSARDRGTATGYYWGASKLGPVVFPPLSVIILQNFGWRSIFQFFSVLVLAAAVAWFSFVRNKPTDSTTASHGRLPESDSTANEVPLLTESRSHAVPALIDHVIRLRKVVVLESGKSVFRSWNIIGVMFATIFMVGIFNVFLAWIPSYLLNTKHLPMKQIGYIAAIPFTGAVSGNFIGGWLSDNVFGLRRKPLMMLGALFTAFAMIALEHSGSNIILTGLILFLTGLAIGLGYPLFSIYPMSLTTRETYPIAYGVTNTGAALGAALFPLATGAILDHYSWSAVFLFLSASSFACLIFLFSIVEPFSTGQTSKLQFGIHPEA